VRQLRLAAWPLPATVRTPLAIAATLLLAPTAALATYSIAATDAASRQVGGAGTSCVGNSSVYVIYGSVPGRGSVMAQARTNTNGRDEAVSLLEAGASPADIIAQITSPGFDGDAARRQYGVSSLSGLGAARTAGFTGGSTGPYAGDRQGTAGDFAYSVQGNILTGVAVIDQTEAAFVAGGCDLADRLMAALEAGAHNGQGDSRCTPDGIPSDGAFVQVDREGETRGSWLKLRVDNTRPENPLTQLRTQFDAWRVTHPCPAPPGPGQPGGDSGTGSLPSPDDTRATANGGCSSGGATATAGSVLAAAMVLALLAIYQRARHRAAPVCADAPRRPRA
jgi:uncharacterized Ntn-hydrolase superfamily protein